MKNILIILVVVIYPLLSNAQTPVFQWAKGMGGTGNDWGQSITTDAAGNVYTTGFFEGTADFDPGSGVFNLTAAGGADLFISKLDASGNFLWAKSVGGVSNDMGIFIAADAAGNTYITGRFQDTADFDPGTGIYNLSAAGLFDIFILKLDVSGNFIWAKSMGGAGNDYGYGIALDAAANSYVIGTFEGTVDFDPDAGVVNLTSAGSSDIFITKLNSSGNLIWAKNAGGTSGDQGAAIALDAVGNIYTTGYFSDTADFDPGAGTANLISAGGIDIFLCKSDPSGNLLWAKNMGGDLVDEGCSVAVDAGGNVFSTGIFSGTADFDPGPGTVNLISGGGNDMFISKLDASGNFVWAKQLEGSGSNDGYSIATDAAGNIYTTGELNGTADFNPGPGVFNLTSAGVDDVFILKLNNSGDLVWAKNMGGTGYDDGYGITVDTHDNVYTTGFFSGTADFNPGAGTAYLSSHGAAYDVFVHKISQPGIANNIAENITPEYFSFYPNPTDGACNFVTTGVVKNIQIEIYSSVGALLYKQAVTNESTTIDLSNQAKGLYFVKVMHNNQIITTKKIVKE